MSDGQVNARVARMNKQQTRINRAAECGIIEEVHCKNFMCHANLTIKLGPLINFIIGHNGSGKSAVLTALQLCLGGKATSTNRGSTLKSFIKTGAEQTTLAVKIKNQGDQAYLPEVYGDSIIVERIFSRAGTSGFKIKNSDGRIISTKKSDLEDILDALALMMDNPMNVLTQDMARQFLNSSNPSEKYRFFIQGTHLEQLDSDYRVLQESLEMNNQQSQNLDDSAKAALEAYNKAERKAKQADHAASITEKYTFYSRQMAWIQVREEEEKLAALEEKVRQQDAIILQRRDIFEKHEADMEVYARERDEAKSTLEVAKASLNAKIGERDEVKEDFDRIRQELTKSQTDQRQIKGEVQNAKNSAKRIQDLIGKEREKIASADNGRHALKMEEIQTAEETLANLREEVQQKSADSRDLDVAVRDADSELKESETAFKGSETGIRESKRKLSSFENERGDWRRAFHPKLQQLLNAIEHENSFREKPVGPLGRYIKLLKPEWSDILEVSSGGGLDAFAVSSKADQSVLSRIMQRLGYDARIYVTSARPIDTASEEPPAEYDTWMRVLEIDNVLVRNSMIINHGIEKTVLEADREKGTQILYKQLPSIQRIYAKNPVPDDRRELWGFTLSMTSGGGESCVPIRPWRGGTRMQTNVESQIA